MFATHPRSARPVYPDKPLITGCLGKPSPLVASSGFRKSLGTSRLPLPGCQGRRSILKWQWGMFKAGHTPSTPSSMTFTHGFLSGCSQAPSFQPPACCCEDPRMQAVNEAFPKRSIDREEEKITGPKLYCSLFRKKKLFLHPLLLHT